MVTFEDEIQRYLEWSPKTTGSVNASTRSPTAPPPRSTASTSANNRSCSASSSTKSASPDGTSRSDCASLSTNPRRHRPPTRDPGGENPEVMTPRRRCQAMTVCVPLVVTEGESFRMKEARRGEENLGSRN